MPLQTIAGEDKQHAELLRLLQAMGEIRRGEETGNPNLEKRDKYLGLSQEFGELLDSMPDIKVSVKYLVQRAENGEGAEYDPYFIEAWEQIYPDFINVLENLTIQLMGDDLAGFKSTHHIWNAIKYLSTEGKPLKDSLKVYDTILPVQPSLDLKGFTVTGIEPSDGILTLGREPDKLEDIVKRASQIGFKRLRTEIDLNNPTDSQSAVLTNYRRKDITPNKGVAAKKNKKGLFERIYNPVTAIPLNFIIGGLPAKIQVWISEKYKKKGLEINSDVCSGYNWMGETVMSAIAAVVCPLTLGLWTVGPTAGYFGYSIIRFIWSAVKDTRQLEMLSGKSLFCQLNWQYVIKKIQKKELKNQRTGP